MDIKFNSVRLTHYLFAVLAILVVTTSAGHRSRGIGKVPRRHHHRREISDYLSPPAQDASYTNYGPPALQPPPRQPYRPGRHLNPPPPTTEAPGYFSRLASWLNPFGGSPTPPPLPEISLTPYSKYGPPYAPSQSYGPPLAAPPPSYGPPLPQPPPAGPQGYLPSTGKGKNCNPCNSVPWNPLPGVAQKDTYSSDTKNVEIQPSINQEAKNQGGGFSLGYAEEVRAPDFSYGPPPSSHPSQPPSFSDHSSHVNSPSGPIPYPHLYPGPMPPLFKARPFNPSSETFQPTPSVQLPSGPPDHTVDSILSVSGSGKPDPIDGHVEVLPPGAEVDTSGANYGPPSGYEGEIRDSPPLGYAEHYNPQSFESHHTGGYPNSNFNIQQSTTVHEEHRGTELVSNYETQSPQSIEIVKSVPAAEFSTSIEHSVHYEESPLIDLSKDDQKGSQNGGNDYTAGLNPPPNGAKGTYDAGQQTVSPDTPRSTFSSEEGLKNSYGISLGKNTLGDSLVASTTSNGTLSHPTSSYGIPGIQGLPLSHEAAKPTVYESYPPSTEKFLISVEDPVTNTGTSNNQGTRQEHEVIVDSYQHQIDPSSPPNNYDQNNGPSGFLKKPEPLVPYRPSSLYVPYPPYSDPNTQTEDSLSSGVSQTLADSGPTTEEPFLDALLKSYNNFKKEMNEKDQAIREHQERFRNEGQINDRPSLGSTTWISQPQPSFSAPETINPSIYSNGNIMAPSGTNFETQRQQTGIKKNKQVQIIIPYTSQYTPTPFQPGPDDWSGRGPLEQTQGRKVPALKLQDTNYVGQESKNVEVTRTLRPLQNLLVNEISKRPSVKQTNNSIDVLRLQKNIDNWTIQEYSRGITSSTALPSSSHPYLLPSKKIPDEYLTSTQSSAPEERIDTNQSHLSGLNFNDLEHEEAASSRVDVPHVQVLSVEGISKSVEYGAGFSTSTEVSTSSSFPIPSSSISSPTSTTTQASWAELPVSISPHNNERVYVVTPQPVKSEKSWSELSDEEKSEKYEAIERAYQVLPQAVNNLASASVSGPENSPLWGIMEHDQYARRSDEGNSNSTVPILYSGHSKVSNTKH